MNLFGPSTVTMSSTVLPSVSPHIQLIFHDSPATKPQKVEAREDTDAIDTANIPIYTAVDAEERMTRVASAREQEHEHGDNRCHWHPAHHQNYDAARDVRKPVMPDVSAGPNFRQRTHSCEACNAVDDEMWRKGPKLVWGTDNPNGKEMGRATPQIRFKLLPPPQRLEPWQEDAYQRWVAGDRSALGAAVAEHGVLADTAVVPETHAALFSLPSPGLLQTWQERAWQQWTAGDGQALRNAIAERYDHQITIPAPQPQRPLSSAIKSIDMLASVYQPPVGA